MSDWTVRKPTKEEYIQIAECLLSDNDERAALVANGILSLEEAVAYLKEYYVSVLDGYVSDAQGYAGKSLLLRGEHKHSLRGLFAAPIQAN